MITAPIVGVSCFGGDNMSISKEVLSKIAELKKGWSYEFKYWVTVMGFDPIELIDSENKSGFYEMDRMHIFKLVSGQYAVVKESGCSCYEARDASIDIVKTKEEALRQMKEFRK